jgi:hypothetical protein
MSEGNCKNGEERRVGSEPGEATVNGFEWVEVLREDFGAGWEGIPERHLLTEVLVPGPGSVRIRGWLAVRLREVEPGTGNSRVVALSR